MEVYHIEFLDNDSLMELKEILEKRLEAILYEIQKRNLVEEEEN